MIPVFLSFSIVILVSDVAQGQVAFHTIALTGDHAPGLPSGVLFSSSVWPFGSSGSGRYGILGELQGPGIDASNNSAVYVGNGGSLSLGLRTGDHAPGASDSTRLSFFTKSF